MGCLGFFAIPAAAAGFFLSSLFTMLFWGVIAPDLGAEKIDYPMAMLVTIALWIAVAPLAAVIARKAKKDKGS